MTPAQREGMAAATIIVHDWNCQCSACGYGGSSWTWMCSDDHKGGEPILPESKVCPGCGASFTARRLADDAREPAPAYEGDSLNREKASEDG